MLLIDVAFVEARPSPWRQAVDLANMMLCLALRSSPELVYRRALQSFTVEEITEGFAAARGLALPSQLRRMLRAQGRDLHAEFIRLLPAPPQPVSIQRWSARRVGLLVGMVLLAVLAGGLIADSVSNAVAVETPINTGNLGCTDMEPLWLLAQSVPSTSQVPCVQFLPVGWSVAEVAVNSGRSVITLNHDRAGPGAIVAELTASCDLDGAAEVGSDRPGMRHYERTERSAPQFSATRFEVFPGGCLTTRMTAPAGQRLVLLAEAPGIVGLTTRQALQQALAARSDGRLGLDPTG
jgi:hypothetical protein